VSSPGDELLGQLRAAAVEMVGALAHPDVDQLLAGLGDAPDAWKGHALDGQLLDRRVMSGLQEALDRSLRDASPFTRSLFEHDSFDASEVERFLNTVRNLSVSTVTEDGDPHAAVVIAACIDGDIHFTVSDKSQLQRNLARSPRVAFTAADRSHTVMGRGDAVLAGRSLDAPELMARLAAASASGSFTPDGWHGSIYRIQIERIFAS
jgi:hypothetical protein